MRRKRVLSILLLMIIMSVMSMTMSVFAAEPEVVTETSEELEQLATPVDVRWEITDTTITVNVEPVENAEYYTYTIYKDDVEIDLVVSNNRVNVLEYISNAGAGKYKVSVRASGTGYNKSEALSTNVLNFQAPKIEPRVELPTMEVGESLAYSYAVESNMPLQWSVEGNLPDGMTQTGNKLTGKPTTAGTYSFTVRVSNLAGTAACETTLVVKNPVLPPKISKSPESQSIIEGQKASFSVEASGEGISYQWQVKKDGSFENIGGATTNKYTTDAVQAGMSNFQYRCVVTNVSGSVSSSAATLTVKVAPTITKQPQEQGVLEGDNATFSITATGTAVITYQWEEYINGKFTAIAGANSSTYTISKVKLDKNNTRYRCLVKNEAGSVYSETRKLSVSLKPIAPQIVNQPNNATVYDNQKVTFSISATGTNPKKYQWQVQKAGSNKWDNISNANDDEYTISEADKSISGNKYRCIVSNGTEPNATSEAALLTVANEPLAIIDYKEETISCDTIYEMSLDAKFEDSSKAIQSGANITSLIKMSGEQESVVYIRLKKSGSSPSGVAKAVIIPNRAEAPTLMEFDSINAHSLIIKTLKNYQYGIKHNNEIQLTKSGVLHNFDADTEYVAVCRYEAIANESFASQWFEKKVTTASEIITDYTKLVEAIEKLPTTEQIEQMASEEELIIVYDTIYSYIAMSKEEKAKLSYEQYIKLSNIYDSIIPSKMKVNVELNSEQLSGKLTQMKDGDVELLGADLAVCANGDKELKVVVEQIPAFSTGGVVAIKYEILEKPIGADDSQYKKAELNGRIGIRVVSPQNVIINYVDMYTAPEGTLLGKLESKSTYNKIDIWTDKEGTLVYISEDKKAEVEVEVRDGEKILRLVTTISIIVVILGIVLAIGFSVYKNKKKEKELAEKTAQKIAADKLAKEKKLAEKAALEETAPEVIKEETKPDIDEVATAPEIVNTPETEPIAMEEPAEKSFVDMLWETTDVDTTPVDSFQNIDDDSL